MLLYSVLYNGVAGSLFHKQVILAFLGDLQKKKLHNRCWSLSWKPGGDHGHGPPFFFLRVLSLLSSLLLSHCFGCHSIRSAVPVSSHTLLHPVCCSSLQPHAPPSGLLFQSPATCSSIWSAVPISGQLLLRHLSGLLHPWSGPLICHLLRHLSGLVRSSSSTANDSLWRSGWIWTRDLWHCLPVLIPLSYRSPTMHVLELILHYLPVVFDTKSGLGSTYGRIGREACLEVWCSGRICMLTTGLRLPYIRHSYNHSYLFSHQIITTSDTNIHIYFRVATQGICKTHHSKYDFNQNMFCCLQLCKT